MDLGLDSKIAIICGASQGLGFATAKELSREGCSAIICSRDKINIEQSAHNIEVETRKQVFPYQVDLSMTDQVINFAQTVMKKFKRVDILVNNTGGPPAGFFMDFSEDDWKKTFDNTFLSAMTLTRQILPVMAKNNWGRIINLQSISVKQPIDNLILSNSIRMTVIGWAKTLANQYARHNITINNIATGYTLTERLQNLVEKTAEQEHIASAEVINRWKTKIPANRLATSEEIAWLVIFLASERASYITGTTIPVDGGVVQSMI